MIGADSRGDMDGERYELEWGSYHITAVHHYEASEKRGGARYMGCPGFDRNRRGVGYGVWLQPPDAAGHSE